MFKARIIKKDILKVPSNIPQITVSLYVQQRVSQEIVATAQNLNPYYALVSNSSPPEEFDYKIPPHLLARQRSQMRG